MRVEIARWALLILPSLAFVGCSLYNRKYDPCPDEYQLPSPSELTYIRPEDPCLVECDTENVREFISPNDLRDPSAINYRPVSLQACVELALQNARVMRDLGGTILRSSSTVVSVNDPAIAYTNPQLGEEAALSQFDASLFGSAVFEKNDHASNNAFEGNQGEFAQDFLEYRSGLSKRAATGTSFSLAHTTIYDNNNQLGNVFGSPSSSWETFIDAEFRQPLLQGAGVEFNRISGLDNEPGVVNGVLIARTNTEISLTRFEQGVRELLSEVENAYWDLYFAYRDLDAKIEARNQALEVWQKEKAMFGTGSGPRQEEAQAREQYFRFESQVVDALAGRLVDGTRINNGSSAGTFRSTGGVRLAERRLRLIIGMAINGTELLKPEDSPNAAPIAFDWSQSVELALGQRPELRQQEWVIKQRELELVAAKNHLLPQLDLIGRYRFQGLGKDLTGGYAPFSQDRNNAFARPFRSNAWGDLVSGNHQEWLLGAEFSMPVGFRQGHAAVRNAELRFGRARSVLREQRRQVMFGLSNAHAELRRAFDARNVALDRNIAAVKLVEAVKAKQLVGGQLDVLLEAQRRAVDAKVAFYRAEVEYMLAIKNVNFEQGTFLEYLNVYLSETQSHGEAYSDAAERESLRSRPLSYVMRKNVVSQGPKRSAHMTTPLPVDVVPAAGDEPTQASEGVQHQLGDAMENEAPN